MLPVSIVTGFLGSGKTTLIARLLRNPAFARTAVIVNEFGEIGLDHELISASDEHLLTLSTGCLCCAVRADLLATLLDLWRRRAAGEIAYERVLIETSGLADPAPILAALMSDRDVAERHEIDTLLALVDAQHGELTLARYPEARRQVALADRLLLTKVDVVGVPGMLPGLLTLLNPGTPLLSAVGGAIAPDVVFSAAGSGVRVAQLAGRSPLQRLENQCIALQRMEGTGTEGLGSRAPRMPAGGLLAAAHSDGIATFSLVREAPVPALALTLWLEALVEHCGEKLLRVKGLVDVAEMPGRPALIHGVRHVFSAPEWLDRWPSADRRTRLVFIGEGVPRHFPARLLEAIEDEVVDETRRQTWN